MIVIGYPAGAPMTGEAMPIFLDLVDRGIIRLLDALLVRKAEDGSVSGFDATDLDDEDVGGLAGVRRARRGAARGRRRRRRPGEA